MNCSKYLWPMVFASLMAGCSFTGGNAPISGRFSDGFPSIPLSPETRCMRFPPVMASILPWSHAKTT